jgi:hypothetical protein
MATPTQALHELNVIKERYDFIKSEIFKLLNDDQLLKNKINEYLKEVEYLEIKYVDLIGDLTNNDLQ